MVELYIFDQAPRRAAEAAGDRQLLWLWEEEAEALRDQARTAVSDLAGYTPGDVALARSPEGCSVFIRHRFLAGPGLSLKTPVSTAQLSFDHFPELDRVLSIGRALLNTAPPG